MSFGVNDLAGYLDNSNVRQFLDYIAESEGTTKHGYRTAFGGGVISDLSRHPNKRYAFTQTDGKKNYTTAAGRYQFLNGTWHGLAKKYNLQDFGARNQDLGAIALLAENGSLQDIVRGDFTSAIQKSGRTWASLPSSPYAQPKRSWKRAGEYFGNVKPISTDTNKPTSIPPYAQFAENVSHIPDYAQLAEDSTKEVGVDLQALYGIANTEQVSTPTRGTGNLYGFDDESLKVANPFASAALSSSGLDNEWLDSYIKGLIKNV